MNRWAFFLLFAAFCAHASTLYTVDVGREGEASVTLSIEGGGSAEVLLPEDAHNFRIVGGEYVLGGESANVSAGRLGIATFSFSSNMLTGKDGGSWELRAYPPEGAETVIYMPAYASIGEFSVQPEKVSAQEQRAQLEFGKGAGGAPIRIIYALEEPEIMQEGEFPIWQALFAALVVLVAAREAAIRVRLPWGKNAERGGSGRHMGLAGSARGKAGLLKRGQAAAEEGGGKEAFGEGEEYFGGNAVRAREGKRAAYPEGGRAREGMNAPAGGAGGRVPTLEITEGKKEMMETFNKNDLLIVQYLLENGGKSARNILERKSGISKSSLSMAIRRLERRKILEVDRTSTTHFVKLAEYFLKM